MRALRAVSTEKGRDPADFALLAYGGSGPVHAAALAAELGVGTAIVPPLAGLFSAAGLLFARAEYHDVRFCRVERARARPRRAARGSTPRCATHLTRASRRRRRPSGGASRTSATAARAGASRSSSPASSTRAAIARARRALRGRARAALRHPPRARLADRHPRASASPRSARRAEPLRARAPAERAARSGTPRAPTSGRPTATLDAPVVSRASLGGGAGRRPAARRRVRHDRRRPARLDGRASTRRATRSSSSSSRRHGPTPPWPSADAIAQRLVANALETAGRRDGDDDLPHRALGGRPRRDGLLGRALRAPTGETVAQAVTIPLQLGSIPNAMRTLLERFGDAFRPGDVYIVNDPFDGASHTPDIFVVKPSFRRRDADRLRGHGRPPRRHRRPRAGLVRLRQHRGLPGGPAPAVAAALRRRASRNEALFDVLRANVPRPARAARRPRAPRSPPATSATARCRSSPRRHGAERLAVADGRPARPHRAAAAPRDRELARRHGDLHRLPGLGRDRRARRRR